MGLAHFAFSFAPTAACFVVFLAVYHRLVAPPPPVPIVLWLRKFHQFGPRRTPFHLILRRATEGFALPVAVRDTRFSSNLGRGLVSLLIVMPFVVIGIWLLFSLVFFLVAYRTSGMPGGIIFSYLIAACAAALGTWPVYELVKRRGVAVLVGADAGEATSQRLGLLETSRRAYAGGAYVIKTDDEHWQDVVEVSIKRASAVIVDVTEVSSNVLWEIETALQRKGPEALILAWGMNVPRPFPYASFRESPEELPQWVREMGPAAPGLFRAQWFRYPLHCGKSANRVLTSQLRLALADSIANFRGRRNDCEKSR
jgi:hypothetical protein